MELEQVFFFLKLVLVPSSDRGGWDAGLELRAGPPSARNAQGGLTLTYPVESGNSNPDPVSMSTRCAYVTPTILPGAANADPLHRGPHQGSPSPSPSLPPSSPDPPVPWPGRQACLAEHVGPAGAQSPDCLRCAPATFARGRRTGRTGAAFVGAGGEYAVSVNLLMRLCRAIVRTGRGRRRCSARRLWRRAYPAAGRALHPAPAGG